MRNIKLLIEYDGTNFSGWQEQRVQVGSLGFLGPKEEHARSGDLALPEATQTGSFGSPDPNTGSFGSPDPNMGSFGSPDPKEGCVRSVRLRRMTLPGGSNPLTHSIDSKKVDHVPTIQACLREAIHKVTGEWVTVYGASRTDAGVHALGQVANFKTSSKLPTQRFVPALNYYLPKEIVVRSAEEVPEGFHAQYSASSKVYRYTVLNDPVPRAINRNLYYHFPWSLDIKRMREATQCLLGRHDFRAFCVDAHNKENTIRTIKSFEIIQENLSTSCGVVAEFTLLRGRASSATTIFNGAGGYIYFVVEADGFLHKMIRGIIGTLLQVGSGKMGLVEFKGVLEARDRRLAGPTVPARGLCLLKVNYKKNANSLDNAPEAEVIGGQVGKGKGSRH